MKFWIFLIFLSSASGWLLWRIIVPSPSSVTSKPPSGSSPVVVRKYHLGDAATKDRLKTFVYGISDSTASAVPTEKWRAQLDTLNKLFESGKSAEFLELLERLLKENPDSRDLRAMEAGFHYLSGNAKEAERSLQTFLNADPKNSIALTSLAAVQAEQGRMEEALSTQRHAVDANPRDVNALHMLVYLGAESGDTQSITEDLRRLASQDLKNSAAVTTLSQQLMAQNLLGENDRLLENAWNENPNDPFVAERFALRKIEDGNMQEALVWFELAIEYHKSDQAKLNALQMALMASSGLDPNLQSSLQKRFNAILQQASP